MEETYQNNIQDDRIDKIEKHTAVMNKEFGELLVTNAKEHAEIKTDLTWLKKTYWIIATASVGGMIGTFFNVFK